MVLHPGRWWSKQPDGRFRCELCPRYCELRPGQRGFCYVRQATDEGVALATYGRSSGFCIDPIEKKPLNHFYPGSSVLSFGTAGCNLGCRFCQNHEISKAREDDTLQSTASPEAIAFAARENGTASVAYTYNDPVIFAEYAIDTAHACREQGVKNVAVTAGYMTEKSRGEFYAAMDAANIDLKGFTEAFYEKICLARLGEVKDTIAYACNETDCWVELTTLLIPGENDSDDEIDRMTRWVVDTVGRDVPMHFTAFHPDFKMRDKGWTPASTLLRARDIARKNGVKFVYTGNVRDRDGGSTWCPACGDLLVERDGYTLGAWGLKAGGDAGPTGASCASCGEKIPGRFAGAPGAWGSRRLPVRIA